MPDFNILTDLYEQIVVFIPNLIAAFVILLVCLIIISFLARIIKRTLKRIGADNFADKSINKIDVLEANNIRLVPSVLV